MRLTKTTKRSCFKRMFIPRSPNRIKNKNRSVLAGECQRLARELPFPGEEIASTVVPFTLVRIAGDGVSSFGIWFRVGKCGATF